MLNQLRLRVLRALGMVPRRPLGVALIAVGMMAFGVVTLILGLADIVRAAGLAVEGSLRPWGARLGGGLLDVIVGAIIAATGLGLWRMRPWAWALAILLSFVGFVLAFGDAAWMIIWGAVLVYLWVVRFHFGFFRRRPLLTLARRLVS